ncbi:DUF4783 domain-containing protein [Plebeiibacterium marinum]|uniref:DUF4783 domain-containing protein n=1 Tax=Plebeiibacterium marinum TaxID=2992111 RepID=A0AAE3MGI0_9BACT|nr:DUF4783 domain-containing protein [Plebeiobacterium marinum]MCW3807090.1 DUF4783 domain-containing protein [Plebeiobacterium marinum]
MKSSGSRKHWLLFLIFVFGGCLASMNAQLPNNIIEATRNANAQELSNYFNGKIELVLPQKSGVFSNSQAKLILEDFFKHNPTISFKVIHQGKRQNSAFAIGKYQSNKSTYRFYFLTKNKDDKTYIHQLRIEKEDD